MMVEADFDDKGYNSTLRPVQAVTSISSNDSGFRDGREDILYLHIDFRQTYYT